MCKNRLSYFFCVNSNTGFSFCYRNHKVTDFLTEYTDLLQQNIVERKSGQSLPSSRLPAARNIGDNWAGCKCVVKSPALRQFWHQSGRLSTHLTCMCASQSIHNFHVEKGQISWIEIKNFKFWKTMFFLFQPKDQPQCSTVWVFFPPCKSEN